MRSLIIFRHASTNIATQYERDYDRELTPRGVKDAEKMGCYLSNQKCKPDLVLCSSAIRAKQTAEIAHSKGNWKSVFFLEPNIYGGDPYFLINLMKEQDKRYNSICLVGHEPNFSAFISKAINTTSYIEFTTAAMAKIDFNIKEWSEIDFGIGKLNWLTSPKQII